MKGKNLPGQSSSLFQKQKTVRDNTICPQKIESGVCSMRRLVLVQCSTFSLYLLPLDLGDLSCIQLPGSIVLCVTKATIQDLEVLKLLILNFKDRLH